jgi:hypothetical protein
LNHKRQLTNARTHIHTSTSTRATHGTGKHHPQPELAPAPHCTEEKPLRELQQTSDRPSDL